MQIFDDIIILTRNGVRIIFYKSGLVDYNSNTTLGIG